MAFSELDIIFVILYALVCVGIGLFSSRNQKKGDFLIAGRNLGSFSIMASILASLIGGTAIVTFTAYVYQFGVSALSIFIGSGTGLMIFMFYSLKVRKLAKDKDFHNLSELIRHKYDSRTGNLSSLIIFILFFGFLLVQFIAGSSILASISGWSYEVSLLISGGIVLAYLAIGGFKSLIRTDIFQYIVIIVIFGAIGLLVLGNTDAVLIDSQNLSVMSPSLMLVFFLFGIFSIFCQAGYWQRVFAAKDDTAIKRGLTGAAILIVISGIVLTMIGLAAVSSAPGLNPNLAFVYGMTNILPPQLLVMGLIVVFAAIMSNADTVIFVLSTIVAKDYFGKKSKREADDKYLTKITRIFIIIFSVSGIGFAFLFRDIISVFISVTSIGFAIVPALIAAFHFRIRSNAAFASLLAGLVLVTAVIATGIIVPELTVLSLLISTTVLIAYEGTARLRERLTA